MFTTSIATGSSPPPRCAALVAAAAFRAAAPSRCSPITRPRHRHTPPHRADGDATRGSTAPAPPDRRLRHHRSARHHRHRYAAHYLYYVLGNGKAIRYGIGVGREGFTWSGVKQVVRKAEWPDWYPPPR